MAGLPLGLDSVGGLCSCEYGPPADTAAPLGVEATELEGLWNRFKPNKSLLGFLSSRTENTFIATTTHAHKGTQKNLATKLIHNDKWCFLKQTLSCSPSYENSFESNLIIQTRQINTNACNLPSKLLGNRLTSLHAVVILTRTSPSLNHKF